MAQNSVTLNTQCFAYLTLHDFEPCKIEYNIFKDDGMTPTMPTSAHIRIYTNYNANHSSYLILHDF